MNVAVDEQISAFTAESTAGQVKLGDFANRVLVLYFYPKDNTPGCTAEGTDFTTRHAEFRDAGATVVGVSRDGLKSHASFKAKMQFPFDLIADTDEALCNLFGVIKMKNMYGKQVRGIERSTFVIDGRGTLRRAWRGVKVPGHVDDVLSYVQTL